MPGPLRGSSGGFKLSLHRPAGCCGHCKLIRCVPLQRGGRWKTNAAAAVSMLCETWYLVSESPSSPSAGRRREGAACPGQTYRFSSRARDSLVVLIRATVARHWLVTVNRVNLKLPAWMDSESGRAAWRRFGAIPCVRPLRRCWSFPGDDCQVRALHVFCSELVDSSIKPARTWQNLKKEAASSFRPFWQSRVSW